MSQKLISQKFVKNIYAAKDFLANIFVDKNNFFGQILYPMENNIIFNNERVR